MRVLLYGLLLVLLALGALQYARWTQFVGKIDALTKRLAARQEAGPIEVSGIPQIVRRFAEHNGATTGGAPVVVAAQRAEMRLDPQQPFFPLTATQVSGTRLPGFVWHAHGTMMVVLPLEIVDAYVDGEGLLDARLAGSITLASAGGADMARGEAMRFLAELPFNPDAILNAPGLSWEQIDERSVVVSLATSGGAAKVQLTFDANGDVTAISAADRPRMVDDAAVPTRWVGRFSDYAQIGKYRLPRHGEIAWVLDDGEFVYWRGGMTSLKPYP